MKILNDTHTDLGYSMTMIMASMMISLYTANLLAYKIQQTLDTVKARVPFLREKKQAINRAIRSAEDIARQLEITFDEDYMAAAQGQINRWDAIQDYANDLAQLLLIYNDRINASLCSDKMLAALRRFKAFDKDGDLEEAVQLFRKVSKK